MLACTCSSDAFDVRVLPPDPDSCQMVLALIHRAAFRTTFSRVSSWVEIRCSSSMRNRWGAWGVARARHARVSLRNGPFRTIPDSLRSPHGFEMRVARPHRRFSRVENRVASTARRQHMSSDQKPKVSIPPAPSHNRSPTRSQTVHRRGMGTIPAILANRGWGRGEHGDDPRL